MHILRILNLRKKCRISGGLPSLHMVSIQDMNIMVATVNYGFTTMMEF
jgi:hypothetical protein